MATGSRRPRQQPTPTLPIPSLALIGLILIGSTFLGDWLAGRNRQAISYSEFLQNLDQDQIADVTISETKLIGKFKADAKTDKPEFLVIAVTDNSLISKLVEKKVAFRGEIEKGFGTMLLFWILPALGLLLVWRLIASSFGRLGGPGGMLTMGKSRAKIYVEKGIKTSFADVAGVDEAKAELKEVVDFLKEPQRYSRLGGRTPKGILLVGPPGTGKTLMARAVAGEASVPFFSINGSEFVEMFVGLGAARVRDLFEEARQHAPCILFIDELDALGKSRSLGYPGSGAHDEKEQTLNQLLAELDGFDSRSGVILLAATNRPEILDPALLRAGRFDRQVLIDNPDQAGREQILQIHVIKIRLDPSTDLKQIAALTPGFSGADLANLVNEAALVATRRNADAVGLADFTAAIERIVAGLERKKIIMNVDEKRRVAYHEMGHATVALVLQTTEKVHKVSIIPRGIGALGYTLQRPTEDRYLMTRQELIHKIAMLLGGRTAERIVFGDSSTGAADDLQKATDIARAMVTQYAMSERLGLATYERQESQFLRGPIEWLPKKEFSQKTAELIDSEIELILHDGEEDASTAIQRYRPFIESAVQELLQSETLDEASLRELWAKAGSIGLT